MHHIELNAESIEQILSAYAAPKTGAGIVALLPEAEKERLPLLQEACRRHGLELVVCFPR